MSGFSTLDMSALIRHDGVQYPSQRSLNRHGCPYQTSLAQFHHIIRLVMDWDDDNLHHFRMYAKKYGIYRRGGANFVDDLSDIFLDDCQFESGDRFVCLHRPSSVLMLLKE